MEVEFDFRKERSGLFGEISRPVAKLTLISEEVKAPQIFYIDSGADITLIPLSVGQLLKLKEPQTSEITEIKGLGEKGVPMVIRKIKIGIGSYIVDSKLGWALIEDVPLLLGRYNFFKYFNITFKNNSKTIFHG